MERLRIEDFTEYSFLSGVCVSPDGKHAVFVVKKADLDENAYSSRVYVVDTATHEVKQLTGLEKEAGVFWLDSETVVFRANRDKALAKKIEEGEEWTVFYAIKINGGEAKELFRVPVSVGQIDTLEDGRFVLTAAERIGAAKLHELKGDERAKVIAQQKEDKDYEVLEETPFWSNGGGFVSKKRTRLFVYDMKTNALNAVTDLNTNVDAFNVKGNQVIYISSVRTIVNGLKESISLYDAETGATTELLPEKDFSVSWANFYKDGYIFTGSTQAGYSLWENHNFYTLKDGQVTLLAEHDFGLGNSVGSDCSLGGGIDKVICGTDIYFTSTELKSSFIKKLDENGVITKLTDDIGAVHCFDKACGKFFFIGSRNEKLQELYVFENGVETCLTSFNAQVFENKSIQPIEIFTFVNDGVEFEGYVIKPVDFDPAKQYPAILDIHGGPKAVYGQVYFHEMQVWANAGFFVFFMNPRGGDGRGNEFADLRGKYGTIDYDDLMTFTDNVLEKYPNIDKNKVGVTGGSYGGFMTNWIIGHTDRFAAAASQRSISSWQSMYLTTDIGYFFAKETQGADPWGNPEKLRWHSPLTYAPNAKTPTLFIHSEEDYRCWVVEGIQMYTALQLHGVKSKLVMFRGENHELSRSGKPKHRIRRLKEITGWFEELLK